MDGTSQCGKLHVERRSPRSQWNKFTQHVAPNAVLIPTEKRDVASEAKWPGADLLYRLDQLLSDAQVLHANLSLNVFWFCFY